MDSGRCGICCKLICGYSRAGKTTYSKQFENVIHLDDFRGFPLAEKYQRTADYISTLDGDVVVEGVFHTVEGRKAVLKAFKGDRRVCIWINTDLDTIALRMTHGKSTDHKYVAPKFFEPPTFDEGWDEIIII